LDLSSNDFIGEIPPQLGNLSSLHFLHLSSNDLIGEIPPQLGNLSSLHFLHLSSNYLSGRIPPQLGNLSSLHFLDLSYNNHGLIITNLDWVSTLSSLRHLDLSYTDLSKVKNVFQPIIGNKLPHLTKLTLQSCRLHEISSPSFHSHVNSSKSLSILDLSDNYFLSIHTFQWLFSSMPNLVHLDFSGNSLGIIPNGFGATMVSLTYLDLNHNQLENSIPNDFGNLTVLEHLDLRYNNLNGEIPKSIWNICTLRSFYANYNNLSGALLDLSELSFRSCAHYSLEYLELRSNQMTKMFVNVTPFSSLKELRLQSNDLQGKIPQSI
ncbi:hypothetical protein F8388_025757, partial [Cannabis sativa]